MDYGLYHHTPANNQNSYDNFLSKMLSLPTVKLMHNNKTKFRIHKRSAGCQTPPQLIQVQSTRQAFWASDQANNLEGLDPQKFIEV